MSGTFATIERKEGQEGYAVAVKTYSKFHGSSVYRHYQRELLALKKLKEKSDDLHYSKHVIYLLDDQVTDSAYTLVFPYYDKSLMKIEKTQLVARPFMVQISKGLLFLHQNGIIHCDLSLSNILVNEAGDMVICDFGCAHIDSSTPFRSDVVDEVGTRYYKAPEHLFGSKEYTPSTDIWSLGAIFAELLVGYPLFPGENDIEQIGIIMRTIGQPSRKVQEEEMSRYPDANKLMFFTTNTCDSDYEDEADKEEEDNDSEKELYESSDSESMSSIDISQKSLKDILNEGNVDALDRSVIFRILTWSIEERMPLDEIIRTFNNISHATVLKQ
ncbi:kinase-like domain-containing protein [Pilobolus umbonatus]|nr:kinase-like domain-containing protein [Pilobolus umbonatus]